MNGRAFERLGLALLVTLSGYFVWFLVDVSQLKSAVRSHDIYAHFYPFMIAAARGVLEGGRGLLWNPFQACGQPLLTSGVSGALYPPAALALFLPPDFALYGVLWFNLAAASVSAYFFCREIGTSKVAAWCGGLTFGLGAASIDLITWTPLVSGPYAWMPAAMLFCERILRRPSGRAVAGLALSIALLLLPGHPQGLFYLYQLIALRVLWELITRRGKLGWRPLPALGAGLILGPLLAAVHLIPSFELMSHSIRSASLAAREIQPYPYLSWKAIARTVHLRLDLNNPIMLIPIMIAVVSVLESRLRRSVVFYGVAAILCVDLALGPNGHLFPIYAKMPLGTLFRDPGRFLWITALCTAPLVALGVDALLGARGAARPLALLLPVAAAAGVFELARHAFRTDEWYAAAIVVAAAATATFLPRARAVAGAALAVALVVTLVAFRGAPFRRLLPSGAHVFSRADLFEDLRARMTPQDRVYLAVPNSDLTLMQKSGTLFRFPVINDYDPLPTRRYAEFFTMMRIGAPMQGINSWYYNLDLYLNPSSKRPLFDLAAARFFVVARTLDRTNLLRPPLETVIEGADVIVYENRQAMARARFVPRVEVVEERAALLRRLADGVHLDEVALVDEEPRGGFHGNPPSPAPSSVEFVLDRPEHVVLRVHAPQRGFLFLADQHYPGWSAAVNGTATAIRRANYLFRLVEVPAGDSLVEFRYRPISLALGAALSALTAVGLCIASYRTSVNAGGMAGQGDPRYSPPIPERSPGRRASPDAVEPRLAGAAAAARIALRAR